MMDIFEEAAVRFLMLLHALDPRHEGLCPPACGEGHTYQWPCRARIRKPKKSNVGAYRDKDLTYTDPGRVIGTITEINEDGWGVKVKYQLIDPDDPLFDETR